MAGRKRQDVVEPNALVASAVRLNGMGAGARRAITRGENSWSKEAWRFYDLIGEYRFAVNWVGNMLSRATLFVAQRAPDGTWERVDSGPAAEALDMLIEGSEGQAQMLTRFGIILSVPGDSYLLGWREGGRDNWSVASPNEVTAGSGRVSLHGEFLPKNTAAVRIWRQHPNDSRYADSASRAVLPILGELDSLTRLVSAQMDSRLTSAGILWVPEGMQFSPIDGGDTTGSAALIEELLHAAEQARQNKESAASLVPLVVTAPGELIEKVALTTFWTPLDEQAIALRQEAIRRLALGMDMPPEILTGMSEVNHWQAWQIDEASIKVHATPPLELITSSLTAGYLWPHLEGIGESTPRDWAILADTSQMRARPNRSREAMELNERGVIDNKTTIREVGFDEDSEMKGEELQQWLLKKQASNTGTPEMVAEALRLLGVDMEIIGERLRESRPDPSLRDHPDQGPPQEPDMSAVLAMCEPIVHRALERAGNRLRNKIQRKIPNVSAAETYQFVPTSQKMVASLLEDAWEAVPQFCQGRGIDAAKLTDLLDSYCTVLLTEQKPHDRELLRSYLSVMADA